MREITNKYLIIVLLAGLVFHGALIFYTLENSYDALIHLFFANHYANSWFEPWNYSWYTGFTVMGYPPLVHQAIAALSFLGGLKFGLFTTALIAVVLFITGVFRFTIMLTANRQVAGYAAIIAVFSSSFVETLHIFGQLPSIVGISILMHALPEIYLWLRTGIKKHLFTSLSLIAVTVTSHHVTPIFGMVFFIFPLIGTAVMDTARDAATSYKAITLKLFITTAIQMLRRMIYFGVGAVVLIVVCILPYWVNSKKNPITQVPIPHGSRDNFLQVTSSGFVFFIIPWGIVLFLLPYIFYRYFSRRYIFLGLSLAMLTLLGTGGTTPIPIKILGKNAFNILTLDRFTLWATILSLPMVGEFFYRLFEGDLRETLRSRYGTLYHRIAGGILAGAFLLMALFTVVLGYFSPLQPQKINMLPIVNFLNEDQHDRWRFLPLGFGDQMAYLSTQTKALTVDGDYHSARRLPELTSRAVERLENSKFRGLEGIGSLQQFLTVPEKYNLKYVISNDKFYDPILFFCGWHRLNQLENGLMVWEKLNVQPLPKELPKEETPLYLKLMWGIIPLLTVAIAFILNIQLAWVQALKLKALPKPVFFNYGISYDSYRKRMLGVTKVWAALLVVFTTIWIYRLYLNNASQVSPQNVIKAYYDAFDFKRFEKAHSYFVPDRNYPISQYMLEISASDGILTSYGKLDAISVEVVDKEKNHVTLKAKTRWVTPLEVIEKDYIHQTVYKDGKWYILPENKDPDIPPDQYFSEDLTGFFKHGRRRISTQQTYHDDVLRQPDLEVISAKLVQHNGEYVIIGQVQNIDNSPADVVVSATLYSKTSQPLAHYSAKYVIKHKLLPKEVTAFRINFEDVAWLDKNAVKPETFNPDQYSPASMHGAPASFNLQCAGNVAVKEFYDDVSISQMAITPTTLEGMLFNSGIQEVTVPQLIVSYYNEAKELIYVDHFFVKEGIRVQRKQRFSYPLADLTNNKVLQSSLKNCYVNGLHNAEAAAITVPNRQWQHEKEALQKVNGKGFSYIKVELNNYVGNPR